MSDENKAVGCLLLVVVVLFVGGIAAWLGLGPVYSVWSAQKRGEAALAEAESSKQVATLEAKAKAESAKYEAEAELIRAHGVAEANKVIGDSLKDNEAYLRYLWITGLHDGNGERIYIPTEAGLPILEARSEGNR